MIERKQRAQSSRRTNQNFVDFESWTHVKIFRSNQCHNFLRDSSFKIDVVSTNFPRGISTSNRWPIDQDLPIGCFLFIYVKIYIYNIYIYIYIVIKEKTDNIFTVKIYRLLPLSIHSLSLYKFRFESQIRLNSYKARYNVVQGANRARFNFYNKNWQYTNNNDNIKIKVKQK